MDETMFDAREVANAEVGDEPIGTEVDPSADETADALVNRVDGDDASQAPATFLERLDRRQNQVLKELDQLNARIEQVLEGFRRA